VNRLNPQLAEGHYQLGRALRARGDIEGAKKAYQRAVELAPDAKQIKIELAAMAGAKPDPATVSSTIEELKAAVAKHQTNLARREQLGHTYLANKQLPEAEAEFKRVLESSPLSPTANRGMAHIRRAQGKADEAVPYLQTVLRVDPSDAQANLLLASHYETKGNRERAIPHVEAIHRTNPTSPRVPWYQAPSRAALR
jgi:cytochrome c-type biogenesis protein CcmH/NrfG